MKADATTLPETSFFSMSFKEVKMAYIHAIRGSEESNFRKPTTLQFSVQIKISIVHKKSKSTARSELLLYQAVFS